MLNQLLAATNASNASCPHFSYSRTTALHLVASDDEDDDDPTPPSPSRRPSSKHSFTFLEDVSSLRRASLNFSFVNSSSYGFFSAASISLMYFAKLSISFCSCFNKASLYFAVVWSNCASSGFVCKKYWSDDEVEGMLPLSRRLC